MQICFDSPVCVGFVIWTSHFSKIIQLYLAVSKNEHLFVGGIYSASELQNLPMWKSSKKKWWLICKMHFFQTLLILGSLLLWSVFEVRKALHINTEPSEKIKIRVERTEGKKNTCSWQMKTTSDRFKSDTKEHLWKSMSGFSTLSLHMYEKTDAQISFDPAATFTHKINDRITISV